MGVAAAPTGFFRKKCNLLRREFTFYKKDGHTLPVETTLIAIRGGHGKLKYIRYILQRSYTVAEKVKGSVTVRSAPEKGSEFTFSFPFEV